MSNRPVILVDLDNVTMWAAGLFEGEGCVVIQEPTHGAVNPSVRLILVTTDRDVVERFYNWAGVGSFFERSRTAFEDHWKQQYEFQANGMDALELINRLIDHMGVRRQGRMIEALERVKQFELTGRNWQKTQEEMIDFATMILDRTKEVMPYVQ